MKINIIFSKLFEMKKLGSIPCNCPNITDFHEQFSKDSIDYSSIINSKISNPTTKSIENVDGFISSVITFCKDAARLLNSLMESSKKFQYEDYTYGYYCIRFIQKANHLYEDYFSGKIKSVRKGLNRYYGFIKIFISGFDKLLEEVEEFIVIFQINNSNKIGMEIHRLKHALKAINSRLLETLQTCKSLFSFSSFKESEMDYNFLFVGAVDIRSNIDAIPYPNNNLYLNELIENQPYQKLIIEPITPKRNPINNINNTNISNNNNN